MKHCSSFTKQNVFPEKSVVTAKESSKYPELNLIPWPQSLTVEPDSRVLTLSDEMRIFSRDSKLISLAEILHEEMAAVFGGKVPGVDNESSETGGIMLQFDPRLEVEEYRLVIDESVLISGGGYAGVAAGTVTFLQSLGVCGEDLRAPVMKIADKPYASYRGLMVDPARKLHSIETLKHMVTLCRWYKIRYLHIHFTDDQSFTFPSQAYPDLPTPGRHYTLEQLRDLENYAIQRGVVLVPELDVPGHSRAAVQSMPELFATETGSGSTINFVNQETCRAVDTIISEMCDVFQAAPYFHIGSDECNKQGLAEDSEFQEAMKISGLSNVEELYRKFIVDRNETVKKLGKQTIVWEGFQRGGEVDVPRDVLVMSFEGGKYYRPDLQAEDGYTLINATWQPLYVVTKRPPPIGQWPIEDIYKWNMYR